MMVHPKLFAALCCIACCCTIGCRSSTSKLESSDPQVRTEAVQVLGNKPDTTSVELLLGILRADPDERVRREAASSLRSLFGQRSLGKKVEPQLPHTQHPKALEGLGHCLAGDSQWEVRKSCAATLRAIGAPDTVTVLATAAKDDRNQSVRFVAASALGSMDDPRALSALADVLRSRRCHESFAVVCIEAEAQLRDAGEAAVPHLIRLLDDDGWEIRQSAVSSLIRIGAHHAKEELERLAVEDPHELVRKNAKQALEEIASDDKPDAP